jgi:DNA-binding NarL/FixJ family response regulator
MSGDRVRVGIADDHDLFREGIAALLGRDPRLLLAGQASDAPGAVRLVDELEPDVLLLDVSMPGDPPRTTIARIRRTHPAVRIVVLTMHQDSRLRTELVRAGASAYVTKTEPSGSLIAAILHAAATDPPQSGSVHDPREDEVLSAREYQVLRLIAQAYSNREIAGELHIAEGTVKRHANNINAKLGSTSRIDAVRKATTLGILAAQSTVVAD